jgi:anti-sigma factor RsiW
MNCDEARLLLDAYMDDELDVATALRMENHLSECSRCRQELQSARVVGLATRQTAPYFPAPSMLRERVKQAIRIEAGQTETPPTARPITLWWKRPMALPGLAAAMLLAIGATLMFWPPRAPNAQVAELVASHVRSLEAAHLFDVESTDQHTVKPWFAGKIEFSPPVIDLSAEGFPLVGGRLDYLGEQKVAALIYRRNKHVINVFVWPGQGAPAIEAKQGFNLIRFECKGMICWAVSDLNLGELQHFVDLFKSQTPASTRS